MTEAAANFSDLDVTAFQRDGYFVGKHLIAEETCAKLQSVAETHLAEHMAPIEFEVDVQYPGAPASHEAAGGDTPRRLLSAYARHPVIRDISTGDPIRACLRRLFGQPLPGPPASGPPASGPPASGPPAVELSQCHHNCIMTKHPGFSSATLWHQDNRYWSFDEQNLISVWIALGNETKANGCLRVIPGSHVLDIDPGRFDASLFLRTDVAENKALLNEAKAVELRRGDVLFFHSRLFHAAGRNLTDDVKLSIVFTYHEAGNRPIENTRSARFPSIAL